MRITKKILGKRPHLVRRRLPDALVVDGAAVVRKELAVKPVETLQSKITYLNCHILNR